MYQINKVIILENIYTSYFLSWYTKYLYKPVLSGRDRANDYVIFGQLLTKGGRRVENSRKNDHVICEQI